MSSLSVSENVILCHPELVCQLKSKESLHHDVLCQAHKFPEVKIHLVLLLRGLTLATSIS